MAIFSKKNQVLIISLVVFLVCFILGVGLAKRKPLWNDEIHTQFHNIDRVSYFGILKSEIDEGVNNPLFYIIQKAICDLFHYRYPYERDSGFYVFHESSQIILRLNSIIFISLSVAVIFYYFANNFSWTMGIYALLLTLTSQILWIYWVEARPYSLWFFLSVLELIFFLNCIYRQGKRRYFLKGLLVVHVLLSLTMVLSVIQIVIVSFILLITFKEKELRRRVFYSGFPAIICLIYYFLPHQAPFKRYTVSQPFHLLDSAFPYERVLYLIFILGIFVYFFKTQRKKELGVAKDDFKKNVVFLCSTFLILFSGILLLSVFKWREQQNTIFTLNNRYFIYLTPFSIFATAIFSNQLMQVFQRSRWAKWNIMIAIIGILIIGCLKVFQYGLDQGLFICF